MALRRDIAPGQNHIALRKWGKTFYSPQLFHLAPTFDKVVPLAIRDIVKAKTMLQVYGVQGLEEHTKGSILINNYPVRCVKIFGRVLSYAYKNYDTGGDRNPNNFYLLTVDDCSGDVSHITVKIPEHCVYEHFEEDALVQVVGRASFVQDYSRQIVGDSLTVLSLGPDLAIEIEFWKQILSTRRLLKHSWKYNPEYVVSKGAVSEPRFSKKDYLHRLEKQKLRLSDAASQITQQFHVSDSFSEDSHLHVDAICLEAGAEHVTSESTGMDPKLLSSVVESEEEVNTDVDFHSQSNAEKSSDEQCIVLD
ncbi:hypothetical protein CJI97_005153 [Candidozyma auris]|nr:hypothetical protein CJI97_005153 [[Candida] auris]